MRDICSHDLLANPRQIGGIGHVVAIDESVLARRKPGNAQGRPVREQWVFGGVDLTTKQFFIELVPRRDEPTLTPIIQRNIVAGTTIWSDMWAAYNNLPAAGYPHQTVNHTLRYVDPVTGCHTNDIESRWNACKSTLKAKWGVPRSSLPSYVDEYMWRRRRERSAYFHDIVQAITRKYPV
jgi:ISXO2-like transposase domain